MNRPPETRDVPERVSQLNIALARLVREQTKPEDIIPALEKAGFTKAELSRILPVFDAAAASVRQAFAASEAVMRALEREGLLNPRSGKATEHEEE